MPCWRCASTTSFSPAAPPWAEATRPRRKTGVALAVIALSSNRLTEGAGRWLKFVSGAVMLALGAVMLLRPEWLVR